MTVYVHVKPDVDQVEVIKHGIVTVPGEMATLQVKRGMRINDIPLARRQIQLKLLEVGKMFIQRQEIRGLTYLDHKDIHVYGPFPSYEFHEVMIDPETMNNPHQAVHDRATEIGAYADYVLVAAFMAKPIETEIWTPETRLVERKGVR